VTRGVEAWIAWRGQREVFDGLWKYYREHRNGNGVMNWRQSVCGGQTGGNGASDADLDSALGLVLADSRWGGYTDDAKNLIGAIGTNETQQCDNGQTILKPGGAFVAKVFQGGTEADLLATLKRHFDSVHHVKPPASRAASVELYLVAKGFRGTAA